MDGSRSVKIVTEALVDLLLHSVENFVQLELPLLPALLLIDCMLAQLGLGLQEELLLVFVLVLGLRHRVLVLVHEGVVAVQHKQQAQLAGREGLKAVLYCDEVLLALGHGEALDVQVAGVQEVVNPLGV